MVFTQTSTGADCVDALKNYVVQRIPIESLLIKTNVLIKGY